MTTDERRAGEVSVRPLYLLDSLLRRIASGTARLMTQATIGFDGQPGRPPRPGFLQ
jgi:hypothetical protein